MSDLVDRLTGALGPSRVLSGASVTDDDCHDESLTATWRRPDAVVLPETVAEVAEVVQLARAAGAPVTARGSGTGLSGACVPRAGGIVIAFRRMDRVLEIDKENLVAVVQPGVTLERLEAETAARGLVYPVFPGEVGGSLGGNVATNAGGMRAVRYGVTRHQVLGLEAVIGTGELIRTGGRFVKSTSGYDLTQLIVGSEGTLAVVTEVTLRRASADRSLRNPARSLSHPRAGQCGGAADQCARVSAPRSSSISINSRWWACPLMPGSTSAFRPRSRRRPGLPARGARGG